MKKIIFCIIMLMSFSFFMISCDEDDISVSRKDSESEEESNSKTEKEDFKFEEKEKKHEEDSELPHGPEEEVPEEEVPEEAAEITVVSAYEYSRDVIPPPFIDQEYVHNLKCPMIVGETEGIKAFNDNISGRLSYYKDTLESNEQTGTADSYVCDVSYEYYVYNGIVGIFLTNKTSTLGSYFNTSYGGFYFDTNTDKELTFVEYLDALGVDYRDMVSVFNQYHSETDYEGNKITYSTDVDDLAINHAIFDGTHAVAATPHDGWGQSRVRFPYDLAD